MSESTIIGTRIRERRILSGIRQSALAKEVGISPSYLNLIEHNRRRIGGKTLLKLAEVLEVEPSLLSEGAEATLLNGLKEAAGESEGDGPELSRTEELAGRFPGWAHLLVKQFRRSQELERTVETLTDRLAHDPYLSDSLHEVISTVTAIRASSSILVETKSLEPEWQNRFHRNINEESSRLAEGAEALVRYLEAAPNTQAEIKSPQDEMHAFLADHGYHFPELETESAGEAAEALLAGDNTMVSEAARKLTKEVLLRYEEDARKLPLRDVMVEINKVGLNPESLARTFDTNMARVFRRLATLPENEVGPIGLVVCDGSGSLTFRKPFPSFSVPRNAGACALWPLFQVLGQILTPIRVRLRQAGRGAEAVQALAVAEKVGRGSFTQPQLVSAHMLILPDDPESRTETVRDVGVNCRICPLPACPARREPSIMSEGF
ncbi:sensory histidine kinase CreC [Roseovarius litorisediminis]|uniref:Sensory histidine kinase CreC n=1 Tax=Roseovarius litorisediminis TaxID=1312363 RepID=A0A1Y5RBV0_9RHOB|nr:helix-turn-helix domain-containing protein [Roseovarius litorisediminis]SLN13742.1 sensory histidine kinase CreC [Roseovarius litorisediminis]